MTKEIEAICEVLDRNPDYKELEQEVLKEFEREGLLMNIRTEDLTEGMDILFDFSYRKDIRGKVLTVIENGKAFTIQVKGYHSPLLLNANELQNIRRD